MTKYLLPCDCGKALTIETTQAGQELTCDCGATLVAPTLREIRQLEVAEETTAKSQQSWSHAAGAVFAVGMALVIGGALTAGIGYLKSVVNHVPPPPEDEITGWINEIDEYAPDQTMAAWEALQEMGLPPYERSPYTISRRVVSFYQTMINYGLVALAAGVVVSGVAVFALGDRRK